MNPKPKSLFKRLIPLSLLCLLAVFNACKKHDINEPLAVNDPVINEAKQWFEAAYPKNAINKPLQVNSDGVAVNPDLSQKIRPDWGQNRNYQRFGQDVIEMPVHASASLKSAFVNGSTKKAYGSYDYSRSSYLLLKKDGKYQAYIMTVIGDSSYLKNDLNKLARNTYNKRDTNFSGTVVYTTPKGKYINSWKYKNGNLVTPTAPSNNATQQKGKIATQNYAPIECVDVFYYEIVDGVLTVWNYAFTVCKLGNGQSDDGPGSAPAPPQCPQAASKISINGNAPPSDDEPIGQPGNDPGFPPPNPPTTQGSPCKVQTPPENNEELNDKLEELAAELELNPDLLIRCDLLAKFKTLATYKPPQSVYDRISILNTHSGYTTLFSNPYFVFQIQNAAGYRINFDRFEINITNLPQINGQTLTASQLLDKIRGDMDGFVDASIASFVPYYDPGDNINDSQKWKSNNPLGAISHLDMDDDGSIILSDFATDHFTVSTIRTPKDGAHPVSGNRSWGYEHNADNSYTFYVTGADRLTTGSHELMQYIFGIPFSKADQLWTSFQSKLTDFVNSHNGQASIGQQTKERPDYQSIKDYLNGNITLSDLKARHGCI